MHHAAGDRTGVADDDVVPEAPEVVCRRQSARPGADDEDLQAGGRGPGRERPALLEGQVTEEAFDGVDADGGVEFAAIAGRLAGVVADAAVDGGETGWPGPAATRPRGSGRPAHDRASPESVHLPDRRDCMAGGGPRRSVACSGPAVLWLVPQVRKVRQVRFGDRSSLWISLPTW